MINNLLLLSIFVILFSSCQKEENIQKKEVVLKSSVVFPKSYGVLTKLYINKTTQFEAADVIEKSPGVLMAVLSNTAQRTLPTLVGANPDSLYTFNLPYSCYSYDGGLSWTTPTQLNFPINSHNWRFQLFNILKANNRLLIVMHRVTPDTGEGGIPAITYSDDNGDSWSDPKLMLNENEREIIIINARNMTQTNTGRIIIPFATGVQGGNATVSTLYSDNNGCTWSESASSLSINGGFFAEPSIAKLTDGRLIMLIRTALGLIYKSYSNNNGTSWCCPTPTNMHSPWTAQTIKPTSEGYLLAVFTDDNPLSPYNAYPRDNLTCAVSTDNGENWHTYTRIAQNFGTAMEPSITIFGNKVLFTFLCIDDQTIKTVVYDKSELIRPYYSGVTEDWNALNTSWNKSGNATSEILFNDGQLHLGDASSNLTLVYNDQQAISNSYTLEFRAKINHSIGVVNNNDVFSTTLGIKVGDGMYRLMIRLEEYGIYCIDNTGTWNQNMSLDYLNSKNDWHLWRVTVNNGIAQVYMDGILVVPSYPLEATSAYGGRLEYWTKSNSNPTDCLIDYTKLSNTNASSFSTDWNSLTGWSLQGSGTKEILFNNGELHLNDGTGSTTTSIYRDQALSTYYTLEFKAKVNSFNPDIADLYGTTMGVKVGDGQYRFMFRLETDGVYIIDNAGIWKRIIYGNYINTKSKWHTWKAIIKSGIAEIYMDGMLAVPAYALEATSYNAGRIECWTKKSSNNVNSTDCNVDYLYFTCN